MECGAIDGMMVGCDGLTDQWMDGMMDGTIDGEVLHQRTDEAVITYPYTEQLSEFIPCWFLNTLCLPYLQQVTCNIASDFGQNHAPV